MPPTSNVRKTSATTTTVTHVNDLGSAPRRTASGRAVRANTTRPSNYYARPFGSFNAAQGANNVDNDIHDATPQGFFPALQFFSDAITALPKEVMRQFTQMKEVEAKIHGPNEKLGEMVDELMEYPVTSRKSAQVAAAVGEQGMLYFTANNSATGSTSASLISGTAPNANNMSAQNSVSGSVSGEEAVHSGSEEERAKRRKFYELRVLTHNLLPNLDEKNVVLAEANRVLKQQLSRLDSVMPHVDNEISEEARLGSMTHWAYSDNRQRKQAGGTAANRRDVAAAHNLAAAASAIHESDIAQARRDAGRETTREKHKGKGREHIDSDFEEKPKKTHAKIVKNKAAGLSGGGLGNGAPVKKRKVDKNLEASLMERSLSAVTKAARALKDTPRSTPTGEPGKKATKAKPAPLPTKRKNLNSSQGSPALASSPLHSTFNAATLEPAGGRPQSARLRQNSTATNLRHERILDEDNGRSTSAPSRVNGENTNGKRKAPDDATEHPEPERIKKIGDTDGNLKQGNGDMVVDMQASRSTSNSGKAGRGSLTGTPKTENFTDVPAMLRSRSMRSMRGNRDESSSEPQGGGNKHKRNASNSHLVKQLAPFNRSPDLGRRVDDMDEDLESLDGRPLVEDGEAERSPLKTRPSRRNTGLLLAPSPPLASDRGDEDTAMVDIEPEPEESDLPDLEPEVTGGEGDLDEDEESEPGDPDDPNEPKYCYCNRGSYGDMIACDNDQCPREWFHFGCTGLREPPDEIEKWYCDECKPLFVKGRGKGRGVKKNNG